MAREKESPLKVDYWIARGLDRDEAKEKVSQVQKERSPLCIEHWVKKGFSEEKAKEIISQKQRERNPRSTDYWLKKGFSEEQAPLKVEEYLNRKKRERVRKKWGK